VKITATDLRILLDTLSDKSPEEISNWLCANEIKGMRYSFSNCPVANWIRKEFSLSDSDRSLVVHSRNVLIGTEGRRTVSIDVPSNLTKFISNFDNGVYPELVKK